MGLCVWPLDGTMGAIMRTIAGYLPPLPPGVERPLRWGDPDHVRELFAGTGIEVGFENAVLEHEPFSSPEADVDWHASRFGPLIRARQAAEAEGRWEELRSALIPLHEDRAALEYLIVLGDKHDAARS